MYLVFVPGMYPQGGDDTPSSFAGLTKQEPKEGEFLKFEPFSSSFQLHCQDMNTKSNPNKNPSLFSRGAVNFIRTMSDGVIIVDTVAYERFLLEPIPV